MRLSDENSPDGHQRFKEAALKKLESFLEPRMIAAMNGEQSHLSVDEIFDEVEDQ